MRKTPLVAFGVFTLAALWSGVCPAFGQNGANSQGSSDVAIADSAPEDSSSSVDSTIATSAITIPNPSAASGRPFSSVGVGATFSSLGIGFQAATPLSRSMDVRAGMNLLGYSTTFSNSGINYDASLQLRSVDALLDWYPFRGSFHVSPGVMLYNGMQLKANTSVPALDSFSLNNEYYMSAPGNPVGGNASLKFNPAAPMVLAGWGSLVPHNKHFSVPFETGVVFSGAPHTSLNLTGNVCNPDGTNCRAISSDPTVQSNILAQQTIFNNDISALKVYPVISIGVAYKFSIGSKPAY
jgi:hypothetical protein